MFEKLYYWAIDFISSISIIFDWLFEPIDILNLVSIAPIYLVVGSAATIGLLRRII